MGHPYRFIPPDSLVDTTLRAREGRLLLRPSSELNQILAGIVARAAELYPVKVCSCVFLGNHCHYLTIPKNSKAHSDFIRFVNSNVAREVNRLHGWSGPLWSRRHRAIVVSDEEAKQVDLLAYHLGQGTKENLVWSPCDWPGVHTAWALVNGEPLRGIWVDRTAMYRARQRGERPRKADYTVRVEVALSALPCWTDLDPLEYRRRVKRIVERIETESRDRHRLAGTRPLGVKKILAQDPQSQPRHSNRSKAPRFHAATAEASIALKQAYREFVDQFRHAADRLKCGAKATFPPGSFPPGLPWVPHKGPIVPATG